MDIKKAIRIATKHSSLDRAKDAAARTVFGKMPRIHHGEGMSCFVTTSGRVSAALNAAGFEFVGYR